MELHDLALVHQKLAVAERLAVEDVAFFVGAYVHSDDEKLAVFDRAVGILKVYRALTDAFYLCAEKSDARFVFLIHEIVVVGFFILCDYFVSAFLLCHADILLAFWYFSSTEAQQQYFNTKYAKNQVFCVDLIDFSPFCFLFSSVLFLKEKNRRTSRVKIVDDSRVVR